MESYELPPRASSLTESMRDIGYSLETAIADVIDNSIAAGATKIQIFINIAQNNPQIAIIDDGNGLNRKELIEAMRCGSTHPHTKRTLDDLGRFGLGLKTASFSQCRLLTVITRKEGQTNGAEWDLDAVAKHDKWLIGLLNTEEIQSTPYLEQIEQKGTLILWKNLDRFCEGTTRCPSQEILYEKIEVTEKHLSLVFHRFLSGELRGNKLDILINGHRILPFDPYCLHHKSTQLLPEEIVRIDGQEIKIQPYILPHHSKLSSKEHNYYQSRSEFVANQGVYVYRNNRLLSWGNWFRLIHKGEATKLARVSIDFPNTMDELWTIDIKKSRAYPPQQVKDKLRQIIEKIVDRSTRVHSGRGHRLFDENLRPVWVRYAEHGHVRFQINKEHPVLASYNQVLEEETKKHFQEVLAVIEDSIPVESIYSDYAMTPKHFEEIEQIDPEQIKIRLNMLYEILSAEQQIIAEDFLLTINSIKTFREHPEIVNSFIKERQII